MQQLISPNQTVLGAFPDQASAEATIQALQAAGISTEQITLLPNTLQPNPPIAATEAKRGAAGGAIAGTVFGIMAGLVLGYMAVISPQIGATHPIELLIGITLLGSGIGAAGGSLMGGLGGAKVSKAAAEPETISADEQYILVAEGISAETATQIQNVLARSNPPFL